MYVVIDRVIPSSQYLTAVFAQPLDTSNSEVAVVQCTLPKKIKYLEANFIETSVFNDHNSLFLYANATHSPIPIYHKIREPLMRRISINAGEILEENDKVCVVLHIKSIKKDE